jgi:phytanoyl-CoA hydroxylase
MKQTTLTDTQWNDYHRDGYLKLGSPLDAQELTDLQERIDAIMQGTADVPYDRLMMQLDSETGAYNDAGAQSKGHKGATLNYRKIQDLEWDSHFLAYLQQPLFHDICTRAYGTDARVACYRAMFMNKPAGRGTVLPWHQDRWRDLDRDPEVTIWTALDPATRENGCVKVIPGSHKRLLNPDHPSGFLTEALAAEHCQSNIMHLELAPGEVVLLHNWLLHASDRNQSDGSRRAFSVCYMDAATHHTDGRPIAYPVVFGDGALKPSQH